MRQVRITVTGPEEMIRLGEVLASGLVAGDYIKLNGVLGVGKTTLVKGIARGLGYQGKVTSPTFTLLNIYGGSMPVYHLDYYRLDPGDAGDELNEEYFGRGVTVAEWPRPSDEAAATISVDIDLIDDDYDKPRQVTITLPDDRDSIWEAVKEFADTGN